MTKFITAWTQYETMLSSQLDYTRKITKMKEAGTLDSRGGIAVSGSNQMASNVSHQARQGSREEALISSCSRCTSVHVEQETANDGHIPREVSVVKKRIPNCEEELQTLKKSKEVHLEDVVDLTHVEELEPLDFKDEEAKLARNLESLKRRYPKPGFIMYRYFLISIALVEKSVVGTEYGVYDENYNNDGEKDEECVFCCQQLRGKVVVHQCQCDSGTVPTSSASVAIWHTG